MLRKGSKRTELNADSWSSEGELRLCFHVMIGGLFQQTDTMVGTHTNPNLQSTLEKLLILILLLHGEVELEYMKIED